ncbi:MAG: FG-GAP-like repeat-containing protein [Bacteroidota bacterium]
MSSFFGFVVILGTLGCQSPQQTRFKKLSPQSSGFIFTNEIQEDSVYNALDFTNLYTGSGVGIGDFNKDGLPDIFMGACMNSSKLFLNKGGLTFQDVTPESQIQTDRWVTGVAVIDINQDTWPDVYLCVSGPKVKSRENLLYVNQQDGTFLEQAASYGIADSSQCTQANFFDYDQDGDLDLYLAVNPTDYAIFNVNTIKKKKIQGEAASTDKLYQNNGDGTFTDVSREAGILVEGYSLGLSVADINQDGWPDIYVTNDFLSNDILYINQQDGTFRDELSSRIKHSSFASMGIDIADINNDGLSDIYVLDMFPEDPYREKMLMPGADYNRFQYILQAGYEPQYSRNTLQLQNKNGTFSEIGQLAGVHKTDWSWSALLADLDNDGLRDIFVANGFLRDIGDLDYINYNQEQVFGSKAVIRERQLNQIKGQGPIKLPNYLFQNKGDLRFQKQNIHWGLQDSTCSNGAAYADLDLDGDLDLIINNLNQASSIYENLSRQMDSSHYLFIRLEGSFPNIQALGTKIWIYYGAEIQYYEHLVFRGYESSMDPLIHFGLGIHTQLDSLKLQWPNGQVYTLRSPPVDTILTLTQASLPNNSLLHFSKTSEDSLPFTPLKAIPFVHKEEPFSDFHQQVLLPHEFSRLGPALAVGDVNGDGKEDVFLGGSTGFSGTLYLQEEGQTFTKSSSLFDKGQEDVDALFLDVDLDNDLDLYVVSGGSNGSSDYANYQDRLYENDGAGNFHRNLSALPSMPSSGSCVRPYDIDADGDLDVFVGGRVSPGKYPTTPCSYLLENQFGNFKDITDSIAPALSRIGMVTDAVWEDIDDSGKKELVVVGEWMPISVFQFKALQLQPLDLPDLHLSEGWWNCIASSDFDQDGDPDFVIGNLGLNTNYKIYPGKPVCLYASDFDENGSIDPIMCQFIDSVEYPIASRDNLIRQIAKAKAKFTTYSAYARTDFSGLFSRKEGKNVQVLRSYTFSHSYLENHGNGEFTLTPLPQELQIAPIQDILIDDINKDGIQDILMVGNSYATEVKTGRYDAFTGATMLGKKGGDFHLIRGSQNGFFCDKNSRKIEKICIVGSRPLYLVANNADSLQVFGTTYP